MQLAAYERTLRKKDAPNVPDDLAEQVETMLAVDPARSWDAAVLQIIEGGEVE